MKKTFMKNIHRDYCSWEGLRLKIPRQTKAGNGKIRVFVRGDLNGDLLPGAIPGEYFGFFEYPAKHHEKGFYVFARGHEYRHTLPSGNKGSV